MIRVSINRLNIIQILYPLYLASSRRDPSIFSKTTPGLPLPPQGSNSAQSSAIPLMSQQQTWQANAATSVQGSLPSLGQCLHGVGETSTLQNV
jgi:hypothetical protein